MPSPLARCGRCGVIEREELAVSRKLISKPDIEEKRAYPNVLGSTIAPPKVEKKKGLLQPEEKLSPESFASKPPSSKMIENKVKKRLEVEDNEKSNISIDNSTETSIAKNSQNFLKLNRTSRMLSRNFVNKVVMSNKDFAIPISVSTCEENLGVQVRPVVNSIVELVPLYVTEDGTPAVDAVENILKQERLRGTPWREIADETIMELIVYGLNIFNFVVALVNAYDIPTYDVGLFLATPPDEGTMSLIEEAVCQELLNLFQEVILMDDNLLKGILECKDLTNQVQKDIFNLINNTVSQ